MKYPEHCYKTERDWKKDVRKRWNDFKKVWKISDDNIMSGSAYYPKEIYSKLYKMRDDVEKMDAEMKKYYKGA